MYMTKDFERTQTRKFNPVYINDKEEADRVEREKQYQEFLVRENKQQSVKPKSKVNKRK